MGCAVTEEERETQIIHQNRVVLPTTPLGITLDQPWLTAQSIRTAPAASTTLQHKETEEEQGLRWKSVWGNSQNTTKKQRFWTSLYYSNIILWNYCKTFPVLPVTGTFINNKLKSKPYLSQNIQLSHNMLQGICKTGLLLLLLMGCNRILSFCFLMMNATIHFWLLEK